MCGCRSKYVPGTDNSFASSGKLFPVSSFVLNTSNVLFLPNIFFRKSAILMCLSQSEFAVTLVASRPEDAFFDPIAHSIFGAFMLPREVKIAFWILLSTLSPILLISLAIFSIKPLSKVFIFIVFSLVIKLLPDVPIVNSWSPVPSLSVAFS